MKKQLSVLIIEDDPIECESLVECISNNEDMTVAAVTNNSYEGLKFVKELLPEIIILDLELHKGGGNGIVFLQDLNKLALTVAPYILVTTNNTSPVTAGLVRDLGADFIYSKHQPDYSAHTVLVFLTSVADSVRNKFESNLSVHSIPESPEQQKKSILKRIHSELNLIGISTKAVGYKYLGDAINMVIDGVEHNYCVAIGKKYDKTNTSVERAMQNAINRAWKNNDIEVLEEHYKGYLSPNRGVPTQTEFVHYYANKIKADYL